MKTQKEIADWLKRTASEMYETDYSGCANFWIGDYNFTLSVGWIPGYGSGTDIPTDEYRSIGNPNYALCAQIVKYNPIDCSELEFMEMPYNPNTGDVYDTSTTLGPKDDYDSLAEWFKKSYLDIVQLTKKGELE